MGEFEKLVQRLSRLPGLGPRSARRIALYLLKHPDRALTPLVRSLEAVREKMGFCFVCGFLDECDPCKICRDGGRDTAVLCVVADVADVWALERSGAYRGRYHVLGGLLCALDGVHTETLNFSGLVRRLTGVHEVILALNTTVEGQTTAHYTMDLLTPFPQIKVTAPACGIPLGGELDYLDEGTLSTALLSRRHVTT